MPSCDCISHGCGKQPNEKSDQAIASFVASMPLADKASGPAMKSGSRLWSLASLTHADIESYFWEWFIKAAGFTAEQEATHFRVSWSIEDGRKGTKRPEAQHPLSASNYRIRKFLSRRRAVSFRT
jgi:hypothetical protein